MTNTEPVRPPSGVDVTCANGLTVNYESVAAEALGWTNGECSCGARLGDHRLVTARGHGKSPSAA